MGSKNTKERYNKQPENDGYKEDGPAEPGIIVAEKIKRCQVNGAE